MGDLHFYLSPHNLDPVPTCNTYTEISVRCGEEVRMTDGHEVCPTLVLSNHLSDVGLETCWKNISSFVTKWMMSGCGIYEHVSQQRSTVHLTTLSCVLASLRLTAHRSVSRPPWIRLVPAHPRDACKIGIWGIWGSDQRLRLLVTFLWSFLTSFCGVAAHTFGGGGASVTVNLTSLRIFCCLCLYVLQKQIWLPQRS